MNFKKKSFLIFFSGLIFVLGSKLANACPYCAASQNSDIDTYYVYYLMIFVAVAYIPMIYLFKTFKRLSNFNSLQSSFSPLDNEELNIHAIQAEEHNRTKKGPNVDHKKKS
jgi:hypothetical protein